MSTIATIEMMVVLSHVLFLGAGAYVLYLVIKALRIYIKKNS